MFRIIGKVALRDNHGNQIKSCQYIHKIGWTVPLLSLFLSMVSSQHVHSAKDATHQFLMTDLENGGPGYKPTATFPNLSDSSASSPIENDYLTHTDIPGRIPLTFPCPQAPGFLRYLLPLSFIQSCEKCVLWLKGPQPPRQFKIRPIYSRIQKVPIRVLNKWVTTDYQRFWVLLCFYVLWMLLFVTIIHGPAARDGIDTEGPPVKLSCISRLW